MFCVVEGPDNSGKSTLCEFLSKELGLKLKHSGGPGRDPIEFFNRVDVLLSDPVFTVFDRFPVISEHVYAPITRNVDTFGSRYNSYRLSFIACNPILIYCRPPTPILLDLADHKAKEEHGDDQAHVDLVKQNGLRIVQRYDRVIAEEYPDALYYDYTAGGPQFRALLLQFLRARM